MRFISWNVNGLRACAGKDGEKVENGIIGFQTVFNALDADFFCLQETKLQEGQLTSSSLDTSHTGTMPKRKAIQAQQYSQNTLP